MTITRTLAAVSWLVVLAAATVTFADPDLWGHVRFGLDIVHSLSIPAIDPYSFTQDRPWINHEWLSEVQMALAYAAAGPAGLSLLKGAFVTVMLFVLWRGWRGVDLGPRIVLLASVAAGTARATLTVRPQIWSLLLFAVLCRTLLSPHARRRWWLPVVFALWANLHGGWIVGLGVAGVWWAIGAATNPSTLRRSVGWFAACAAATMLTPYGTTLWAFMLATVRLGRDVQEWQPIWTAPPGNWVLWIAAAAVGAWAVRGLRDQPLPTMGVFLMLVGASVKVERLLPFLVVAVAAFAAPVLRQKWPARDLSMPRSSAERRVLAGFAAAGMAAATWVGSLSLSCVPVRGTWVPDAAAAEVLRSAAPGRLVTFFDWGEYAIWHFGPGLKVSMDGRRETVYSPRQFDIHAAILRGDPEGFRALEDWRPEYVWLPVRASRTKEWLREHGYGLDLETDASFVAARLDRAVTARRPRTTEGNGARCFPD